MSEDICSKKIRNAYSRIHAVDYDSNIGCKILSPGGEESIVADIHNETFCVYKEVDFDTGATGFQAKVRTNCEAVWIEIRLDSITGPKIGMCLVAERDTGEAWNVVKTGIYGAENVHTVYLIFIGADNCQLDIDWFQFTMDEPVSGKYIGSTPIPSQVPFLGPRENNFIGSGIAGGGGDTRGIWDFLIGPAYSCVSLISREEIRLTVDGYEHDLTVEMRRGRGNGIFYGICLLGDLKVYIFDFAMLGEPWIARLISIDNLSKKKAFSVGIRAYLRPAEIFVCRYWENPASHFSICKNTAILMQQDGQTEKDSKNYASVTFNDAFTTVSHSGSDYILETTAKIILPGDSYNTALYHYMHHQEKTEDYYINYIRTRNITADLENCMRQWNQWLAQGVSLDKIPDLRVKDIIEANIINIKMQQGLDGGIMAAPRTYLSSWVRDSYAALRGMAACGHTEEAGKFIFWLDRVYHRLRKEGRFGIPDCAGIGTDFALTGWLNNEENWVAETPALYVLLARDYFYKTGDLQTLVEVNESLQYAMEVQLQFAESHGWRFHFNGDETESGGSGILVTERPGEKEWSMTSLAYCSAALEFFITYLQAKGDVSLIPEYREKLVHIKDALDDNFWMEDLGIYDWYRGVKGEWPTVRMVNYHLAPLYYKVPLNIPERAVSSAKAMRRYIYSRGFVPNQPGCANNDFCGHAQGYMLSALIDIDDQMKDIIYESLINSGITGCWGTWSEAYHSSGINYWKGTTDDRMHNLRPFESGINIDAIMKYWGY